MRPFTRKLLTGLAVLSLGAAPVLAQGNPMGHGHGHGPRGGHDFGMMLEHMAYRLDLTDEQLDQIREMAEETRAANEGNREELRNAHDVLADLLHAESFDEAAIRVAAEDLAAAQTEMILSHAWLIRDVRGVLTPEQLEEFEQMRAQHQGMGMGKGQRRGHGHHGRGQGRSGGYGQDTGQAEE
jgi:Spy/CpxP family protein refolding chaperone